MYVVMKMEQKSAAWKEDRMLGDKTKWVSLSMRFLGNLRHIMFKF